ncbi:glycosyltransferase [Candidatus Saccharibacteria bacterium]|nr:glycosyltransferase [Candidatus Saccharibacteria bacterium]
MKIVIASDIYYPMTNGVAVFAHNLANGLAKRGHEVMVIAPSFNGKYHVDVDKKTKVKTIHLTSARFPFYPDQINDVPEKKELFGKKIPRFAYKHGIWWSINPYFEIKKVLDEFQPDVVHLQTAESIALAIMHYVHKNNVPIVSTGHAYPDNVTGQFKFLKPVKKPVDAAIRTYMASFLKHSEYATVPTEIAIEGLLPNHEKKYEVPVEAISNGIDLSEFRPGKISEAIRKKYNIDITKPKLIYVGRVDPEKSINISIDAFYEVAKNIPDVEFLIVGDGIDRDNLKNQVANLGIESKVKFLGRVMPPDLQQIYRAGDVFVTASETETQGIVLIEAAATGLPLVAVDAGAVRELCQNKKNGILCQPGDVKGIARAIIKILSDKELKARYGKESLEIAKKHDLNYTLSRFEEIYQTAIKLQTEED